MNILNILKHSKLNYFPEKRESCHVAAGEAGTEASGAEWQQASRSSNSLLDRSQITQLCVTGAADLKRGIAFMSTGTILSKFPLYRKVLLRSLIIAQIPRSPRGKANWPSNSYEAFLRISRPATWNS